MDLFIDNKSGAPIYDQIYTQIKDQIIQGALQPDEAMPSIRGLARDLRISVITTKRAYDELEKEGFLYAVPAKGFFVAPKNTELLWEENLKKIEAHLTEAVRLSASCGLSREELREMLELYQIAVALKVAVLTAGGTEDFGTGHGNRGAMGGLNMNALELQGLQNTIRTLPLDRWT